MEQIRVRMAPSPTGEPHLGTARTAIFNYVFAKKYNGVFILRIEDTDKERSKKEYEKSIINGLNWLGLAWDEGPVRQSERIEIYKKYLEKLLNQEKAYYCFCSKEELEQKRNDALARGEVWRYPGTCRNLLKEKVSELLKQKKDSVIRIKTYNEDIDFPDIVRGKVIFKKETIDDFIIAKDLNSPLYNFAAAIDDFEMQISHVIRGEEHLSNTPKQIIIQKALELKQPHYAHLPLILATDHSKFSKRHGAFSIKEFQEKGYLPEALFNFLALLGWHPKRDREVLSKEEIIREFELERVQKAGAIFNLEKLNWLNGYYLRQKPDTELLKIVQPRLKIKGNYDLILAVKVSKERSKTLRELADSINELLGQKLDYNKELLVWKKSNGQDALAYLDKSLKILEELDEQNFSAEKIKQALSQIEPKNDLGRIYWPLRAALSGKKSSPPPFELAQILGKKESLNLLKQAIAKLEK